MVPVLSDDEICVLRECASYTDTPYWFHQAKMRILERFEYVEPWNPRGGKELKRPAWRVTDTGRDFLAHLRMASWPNQPTTVEQEVSK